MFRCVCFKGRRLGHIRSVDEVACRSRRRLDNVVVGGPHSSDKVTMIETHGAERQRHSHGGGGSGNRLNRTSKECHQQGKGERDSHGAREDHREEKGLYRDWEK